MELIYRLIFDFLCIVLRCMFIFCLHVSSSASIQKAEHYKSSTDPLWNAFDQLCEGLAVIQSCYLTCCLFNSNMKMLNFTVAQTFHLFPILQIASLPYPA